MLKTVLMEVQQNGSSIDCLYQCMNQVETLVDKSLRLIEERLDAQDEIHQKSIGQLNQKLESNVGELKEKLQIIGKSGYANV